ncbi:MAG: endonuclease [Bacteroidaceae bacterium]|nr:endonuclease [Bacteroidaceae bacterium]
MKKLTHLLLALTLTACGPQSQRATAQSVNLKTYYSRANGRKQAELKTAMYQIIGSPKVLDYGALWSGFYETDRMANNQVIDRYSNEVRYFSGKSNTAVTGMNKEHGIANSWWGKTKNATYSDLHHLMPSDIQANSDKSNFGMGVVTSVRKTNGSIKVGKGTAGNNGTVNLWEPADKWKGDFARIYFYLVTAYEQLSMVQTEGANTMQTSTYPKLQPWAYQLYLQWSRQDPVDDIERARNDAVYKIQGNRNPFIDYPTLAEYIWGDSTAYAFDVSLSHVPATHITAPRTSKAGEEVYDVSGRRIPARSGKNGVQVVRRRGTTTKRVVK